MVWFMDTLLQRRAFWIAAVVGFVVLGDGALATPVDSVTVVAKEVTLPALWNDAAGGTISNWRKQIGDRVEAGSTLVTIESGNGARNLESLDAGYLAQIIVPAGSTAKTGDVIALMVDSKEMVNLVGAASDVVQRAGYKLPSVDAPVNPHVATNQVPQQSNKQWVSQYDVRAEESDKASGWLAKRMKQNPLSTGARINIDRRAASNQMQQAAPYAVEDPKSAIIAQLQRIANKKNNVAEMGGAATPNNDANSLQNVVGEAASILQKQMHRSSDEIVIRDNGVSSMQSSVVAPSDGFIGEGTPWPIAAPEVGHIETPVRRNLQPWDFYPNA